MKPASARALVAAAALSTGCASASRGAASPGSVDPVPDTPLLGEHGATGARELAAHARLTVLIFFSPDCHCLSVHEPRLRALYEADHPRGVQFVMVDSEVRGSADRDAEEARRRGYVFPILRDPGARLAAAVGAAYATYAVVLDAAGRVHYRGGIDSDKTHLHDDATPYLELALGDLLEHREPRVAEGKALGCTLETW